MAGVSNIVLKIGAETAEAVSAIKSVNSSLDDTAKSGSKLQAGIQKAAIPAAAAFTALSAAAISSAKAAAEDQQSRQQLDSQIQRSIGSSKEAIATNEEWVSSLSKSVAVSNEELRPALAGAVRATGDLAKAHQMLKTALDVSAATGKPLGSVVTALGKAYNGSASSLKRLVPSLSDAAIKSGNYAKIQAELNKQVGGAAKGQAQTAAGQYKAMQIAMHELQVEIGTALLPVLEAFIPMITQVVDIFAGHSDVIVAVAGAVGVFAGAILVANAAIAAYGTITTVASAATTVWAGAQWLLNAAWAASGIGTIIVAVGLLTAGIILAYRHSATFRSIVQSAFAVARQNVLLLLGPIGIAIRLFMLLYQNSGTVRAGVAAAMRGIADAVGIVVKAFHSLIDAGSSVRGLLVRAFNAIADAINALVGAIESVISAIGRIHFPSKPSWVPFAIPATIGPAGLAAGSTGPVINISVSGAIDPESTALAIRRVVERYDRRRGRSPLGSAGNGSAPRA